VAAFSANKGGVGKTRQALLAANCLEAAGKRVLVVDMDFNNSATFYYLPDEKAGTTGEKDIADTLSTNHRGVGLIASSCGTWRTFRSINEKRLSRMMPAMAGKYDIVIIDCQPDYNDLTLNVLNASNLIITPILKDLDSYNAATFLGQKIALDTDKQDCWYITINGYNRQYEEAVGGKQKEYIEVYRNEFLRITDPAAWFP
jgi:chromosome partitioning protein